MDGVQIVVLEMHQVQLPDRHRIDFAPIEQLHAVGPGEGGVDATVLIVKAHLLPMEGNRLLLVQVPDHHSPQPCDLIGRQ
jgi:hypothetical protein